MKPKHDNGHAINRQAVRSHAEVAEIMKARGYPMSWQAVWDTEQRALRKLKVLLADCPDVDIE
jgi:hypothetical protein